MTEFVGQAAAITKAIKIPLVCDAGTGFGDAINMIRCVREFELAGVSGIHIEDQITPKRVSYHRGIEHVVPLQDFLEKITVALEARTDPDFIIIARTDCYAKQLRAIPGSFEEAIRRCQAFAEAGVDVIEPNIGDDQEKMKILRDKVPNVPFMGLKLSLQQGREQGVQMISAHMDSTLVVAKALQDYYRKVRETGNDNKQIGLPPETLQMRYKLMELIGLPKLWEIEERTTEKGTEIPQLSKTDFTVYRKTF
jgi:methylisocitrate lyase